MLCHLSVSAQDPFDDLRIRIERLEQREHRTTVGSDAGLASSHFDLPPAPFLDGIAEPIEPAGSEYAEEEKRFHRWMENYRRHQTQEASSKDIAQDEQLYLRDTEIKELRKQLESLPTAKWLTDGLTFASRDGHFKTHWGGVVQYDAVGYPFNSGLRVPGGAGTQPAVEARRLRLRAEGTMYENVDWITEFDFAGALQNVDPTRSSAQNTGLGNTTTGTPPGSGDQAGNVINVIQPTTVFAVRHDIPVVGNMRIGNQDNWLGLERITSARFQDFMERSPIMDAFTGPNNNGYTPGISFYNHTANKMATWQIGAYNNTAYNNGYTYGYGNQWAYGGRLTWTPYYDEPSEGRYLVHTGLGVEYRQFNTYVDERAGFDNVRVRSRGVLREAASTITPNFADTGNFFATGQTVINPEIAIIWDRWTFAAEQSQNYFYGARTNKGATGANNFGTVSMKGGYVEALYFLTGEHKVYNRNFGSFGRLIPLNNFSFKGETKGAWQVGTRYHWLDLNGGPITGGTEQGLTLGVNWFWNPNTRIQFNYVFSHVDNPGYYLPTTPGNGGAGPYGSMVGSRFQGDGNLQLLGTRLDFNF